MAEKAKKAAIADRQWIDAAGKEVDDNEKATGFRYVWKATGRAFVYQFNASAAGNPETMLAIFGGLTKAGNIANTKDDGDPIDSIAEWFKGLDGGTWPRETGVGGPRYNAERLAAAIASVKGGAADGFLAKCQANADLKLPDGSVVKYMTAAMRNKDVAAAYAQSAASSVSADVL